MASRLMVIGLDGAVPELVFERWRDELPTLRALAERGRHGILRSCDPPITVPAWACMTSGHDPGGLGIYGFRNRRSHSYDALSFANSRWVRAPRVWDVLSQRGRHVIVLGVPPTYPAAPVNGVLVSCFLAPDSESSAYVYPAGVRDEIAALCGRYRFDAAGFRTADEDRLLAELEEVAEARFGLAEHLLATRPWDLFFMVEMGTDRVQHRFWRHMDPEHPLHEPGGRHEGAILEHYRRLDERIARLLRFADDSTAVLVVSDHGARRNEGAVCLNEWLRREGYLVLREEPGAPAALVPSLVDCGRTRAWGEGGYYGRVFLNVAGREREGAVAPDDYDAVRDELRRKLEALGDERGRPIGTIVHRPEDLYRERNGVAPDLLVYFGNLAWRSVGDVGGGTIHRRESDGNDANHAHEGLYILAAEGVDPGRGPVREIREIAPLVLSLLGEAAPAGMRGAATGRW